MKSFIKRFVATAAVLAVVGGLGWAIFDRLEAMEQTKPTGNQGPRAIPVEVADIEIGSITLQRTFSGTLEAPARFVVAPKVSGRVERIHVDLSDTVTRGQTVAELDNGEFVQAVHGAEADLAVARAHLAEAKSALEIAARETSRIDTLQQRGVASESQLDAARADHLAREAQLEVAKAQVTRAEASLETARIRLGYTTVVADWPDGAGDDKRVVSERFVNPGDTVSANAPIMSIVELDPIMGVIYATEKDYGKLHVDQSIALTTDAYPGETFQGRIARIAPIFRESSRQARIEMLLPNADHRLKPGMFIRAAIVLDRVDGATVIPAQSLTRRDDQDGIFIINDDGKTVRWQPVRIGIRADDRVQLLDADLTGRVVTLGQQMVDDGVSIVIPDDNDDATNQGATGG